jgi:signal transduction histidine kinase
MLLSVGFSIIFYRTSTAGLNIQLSNGPVSVHNESPTGPDPQATNGPIIVNGNSDTGMNVSNSVSGLNVQLQKRIDSLRQALVRRLVMLNVGALVLGTVLSWYIARKTLRPIENAMEAQTRFSSDASHELRTPLTALRAKNEVALRNARLTLTEAKKVIKNSVDQTLKLEKLFDGLLRLSRENGKGLAKASISLEEIANEAMNHVIAQAQARRITIDETVSHINVIGDSQSLVQIVAILLDNAIKYSDRGSTIYLEGGIEGKHGILSVRDDGPGIRASDIPHIFERFYRADSARTKHGEHGYGLGLSIAKKLIEQNDGAITVKSTLDEGSTFTLKVPLAKS